MVCILFGLVLGVTPIGGGVVHVVTSVGAFASAQLGTALRCGTRRTGSTTSRSGPSPQPSGCRCGRWPAAGSPGNCGGSIVLIVTTPAALATLAVVIAGVWVWHRFGPWPISSTLVLVVGRAGRCGGWRWPAGFRRYVRLPLRAWRRSWWVYRRRWVAGDGHRRPHPDPARRRVHAGILRGPVDRLRWIGSGCGCCPARPSTTTPTAAPRLAQTFGAAVCRVRSIPGRVHELVLWLLVVDPLTAIVEPLDRRRRSARPTGCRSRSRRTARRGGCGSSAPTSWSSGRPVPGRGR